MKAIFKYNVLAHLPETLRPLEKLAFNCWFSWNHDVGALFRRMDVELWESCKHNPVYMLRAISQQRLEERVVASCVVGRIELQDVDRLAAIANLSRVRP